MDLKQLRYFVHAAQARNLTAASSTAWITQSALSRQMKLLEDDLGVKLFERQARGIELTEAGLTLLAEARALLHQAERMKALVGAAASEPHGPLRIGAPPSLRPMLIAPLAARLVQQCPKVQVSIREGTSRAMRDALANGELDLIVVSNVEPLEPFKVQPLARESLCWVGPPAAPLSMDKPVQIRSVGREPLILTAYPNSLRQIVDRQLADAGIQHPPVLEADMVPMMLDLVRRGVGYAVLPCSAIQDQLLERRIKASPIRGALIEWVVVRSRERPDAASLRAAIDAIREIAESQVRGGHWPTSSLLGMPRRP